MKGYVIDASIIAHWLLKNSKSNVVDTFLKKNQQSLYSHKLIDFEVLNALRFQPDTLLNLKEILSFKKELGIIYLDFSEKIQIHAFEIGLELGEPVYDSSYHALAIANDLTFVTLDKKYYQKAKQFKSIQLL